MQKLAGQTGISSGNETLDGAVRRIAWTSLHDIALDEGNYILRLAVRDERTGLMGSENAPLKVRPINGPK